MRVLVIDKQGEGRDLLERALRRDDHIVAVAISLQDAGDRLQTGVFDVIVLDIDLPDGAGLAFCRALRQREILCPILILTADKDVRNRVASLDSGADDFLAKPYAVAELRARVRALGRRGTLPQGLHLQSGDIDLDFGSRVAMRAGVKLALTQREWTVLEVLAARRGKIVARREILEIVWGGETRASSASLDVIIARIRRKVGEGAVRTLRGEGYALDA